MSYSALSNTSYLQPNEVTEREIESDIAKHGVTPGGLFMMKAAAEAAQESIASGLYVTWSPHPSCTLNSSAYEGIANGTSQCCRIGSRSLCLCGHYLATHTAVKVSKTSYTKPPTCQKCRCTGFAYCPARPEELGQWWLPRRKDFTPPEWQKRLREKPHEYACIGCEQKVSDHETVFESRDSRIRRGAAADTAYIPLNDNAYLTSQVIDGQGKVGGRARGVRSLPSSSAASGGYEMKGREMAGKMIGDASSSSYDSSSSSCSESSAVRYARK